MTRPPWILLLPLLLLGAGPAPAAAADGLELQIIPDAWPSRPRVIGYEYNQKNHHDAPDFIGRKGGAPPLTPVTQKGRRYRLVGVRLVNPAVEERQIKIRSPQFRRGKKVPATVPPEGSVSRYLVVREPDDLRLRVEILDRQGATLIARELLLPEKGRSTRRPSEALAIARELEREDLERRLLATRPVRVTVFDDLELPVPAAHLVLLLDGGMMVYEGDTGEEGAWEGRVIPGAYRVFALAEVPDRTDRELRTAVTKLPRLLALEGRLGPAERELRLAPQRAITVRVADVDHRPIEPRRLWITPAPFLEAYRYELIASRLRGRARIDSTRNNAGGRLLLLASPFPLEVALHAEADAGLEVFLRGQVLAEATRLEMIFDPAHSGRVILDPMTGAGPGSRAEGRLVAVDGAREGIPLDTEELLSLYLSPGRYRVQLRHHLASGGYAEVAPFLTEVRARETVDLTPRLPFDLALYFKRKDRKFQFWLAVTDAAGRVFSGVPGAGGRLLGILDGRAAIDQKLGSLRWELVERLLGIDLQKLSYQVELPFGEER
ncbi:MAG: hypothetical protein ACE5GW_09325, partial [Planctomycetota bacterium]